MKWLLITALMLTVALGASATTTSRCANCATRYCASYEYNAAEKPAVRKATLPKQGADSRLPMIGKGL